MEEGVAHELPVLCFNGNQRTDQENVAGFSGVPLREPCKRTFNERRGTAFNLLEYPTDIVLLVVLWRLRYTLSLRDLAAMFLERGFEFTHEAVRGWEARFAPLIADQLRARATRAKRRGPGTWMKPTSMSKGNGALSREPSIGMAIWLIPCGTEKRDMEAAKRFDLRKASKSVVTRQNG